MPPVAPPPTPGTNWRRWSKNISFWMLLILVSIALFQISSGGPEATRDIPYSDFSHQLENHNVARITVEGGRVVRGSFKDEVAITVNNSVRKVRNFSTTLPFANSDAEFARMRDAGIPLDAKGERPSMIAILVAVLPWVL